MALSHGRPYHHKSAFTTDFLRPSLYISGDRASDCHDASRRASNESNASNSVVWREVYASIVANEDAFVLDAKSDPENQQEEIGRRMSMVAVSTCNPPSISITRQLAFGKFLDEDCPEKRRCTCNRANATMFVSVVLVAICFIGVLVLRLKEMEVDKRLLDSWLRKEKNETMVGKLGWNESETNVDIGYRGGVG